HIAVDDAVTVRVRKRLRYVAQHTYHARDGKLATARELRAKRFPFDEGHRVKEEPTRLTGGQHPHDMPVLKPCRELDLPPEALGTHGAAHLGRQYLDHHQSPERRLGRDEHSAHPSAAELALDIVRGTERRLELLAQSRRGHAPPGWNDPRLRRAVPRG